MAVYSSEELKRDIEGAMKNFQNPMAGIEKEFGKVVKAQQDVIRAVQESRTVLETAKAFLKNPKAEGIKIVQDGLRAADRFFANLFKLLTKDIGAVFLKALAKLNAFILAQLLKLATLLRTLNNALRLAVIKELVKLASRLEKSSSKALQAVAKAIQGNAAKLIRDLLKSFDKSVGPTSNLFKNIGKNSQALAALKDLPKSMGTLVSFVKLIGKAAPFISSFVDMYWKNDVTNRLKALERKAGTDASVGDKQFAAIIARIGRLESAVKGGSELTTIVNNTSQTLAAIREVNSAVRQGSSKSDAIQASINRAGAQNYGPQLQSIQSTVNTISAQTRQGPQQQQVQIDYARIQNGVASALSTLPQQQQQTPIDYARIQSGVASALATFKPAELKIPSDLARKSDLADLAKRSDLTAIPSQIKQPDLSSVLNAVNTLNGGITRLGSDIARNTVNLQPIQQQLTSLSSQLLNLPASVASNVSNNIQNTVNNLGSTITNNVAGAVSNIVTNNNQTIVNNIGKGLDVSTIINPIKSHIDTQVAAPLKTTMQVLNVNDLQKGMNLSAESLIKQSGFQQFGSAGTTTVTNLLGLTAAIAAPLFMRAGFHQLGTEFPADIRVKDGAKVAPTTALGTSHWQFNQITNLVGIPTTHLVKNAAGVATKQTFQNQSHAVEEVHAQVMGIEQDVSAVEKYCFTMLSNQEMMVQMILQNKYDIDVLVDESGAKTKQKIVPRPGLVTHVKGESFFDKLMNVATNHMVVREWSGDLDAKQLALKTNMEAQIAALSNKFEFDKTNPTLPIVDRQKQNPKAAQDEEWQRYVNTSENPGKARQSSGMPVPEIKEIKYGSDREVPKPTKDPSKLLGG